MTNKDIKIKGLFIDDERIPQDVLVKDDFFRHALATGSLNIVFHLVVNDPGPQVLHCPSRGDDRIENCRQNHVLQAAKENSPEATGIGGNRPADRKPAQSKAEKPKAQQVEDKAWDSICHVVKN